MNSRYQSRDQSQTGLGWKSTLVSGFNRVSNLLPDADANARPIFKDEMHAVGKPKDGRLARSNFTGPGTHTVARLQREPRGKAYPWMAGDPPRNFSDAISENPISGCAEGYARCHVQMYTIGRIWENFRLARRRRHQ